MSTKPEPKEAKDVTPELIKMAEEVSDYWFTEDGPIDWEDFIDRLSVVMDQEGWVEFREYDSPAIRKIQRHIREYRRDT